MYNRKIIKEASKTVCQKKQKRIKSIILEAINRFWTSKIKYLLKLGNKEKQSNSKTQFSNAIKNPSLRIENFNIKCLF